MFRSVQFQQAACRSVWLSSSKATQNDKQLTYFCLRSSDVHPRGDDSELCILALQVQSLCLRGRVDMDKDSGDLPLTDSPKRSHHLPRPSLVIRTKRGNSAHSGLRPMHTPPAHLASFPAPVELGSRLGLAWLSLPLSF